MVVEVQCGKKRNDEIETQDRMQNGKTSDHCNNGNFPRPAKDVAKKEKKRAKRDCAAYKTSS